jgi:glycosyltransferase involved in cell wall biosynthesis
MMDLYATQRLLSSAAPLERSGLWGGLRRRGRFKSTRPDQPLVSIVTAVLNGAASLSGALESVLRQPYDNVEYIVIDGGSTDGTLDLLRARDDSISLWVSEPDRGVYDAMNKAVDLAAGDYVCYLGADDRMLPCLDRVVARLRGETAVWYGDVRLQGSGRVYGGPFSPRRLARTNICHQAMFFPRAVLAANRYDLRYPQLADWALNMKLWGDVKTPFRHMPVTVAEYNEVTGQSATHTDEAFARDYLELVRRSFPRSVFLWRRTVLGAARALKPLLPASWVDARNRWRRYR